MSLFQTTKLACPACGKDVEFKVVHSVNIDRKPELREEIVAGTFQQENCGKCGEAFRLDPEFTYTDLARNQWIAVFALDELSRWQELEAEVQATFDVAYGSRAPAAARALGAGIRPRLVFGWPALCEKLAVAEHGLDDVELELMKVGLLRSLPRTPFTLEMETELRFLDAHGGGDASRLSLGWFTGRWGSFLEGLEVPRDLYDGVVGDDSWKALRVKLSGRMFVDMARLIAVGSGAPVAE